MRNMKRILLPVLALALAFAACGESAKFTDDFNEAQKPLEALMADMGSAAGSPDSAQMNKIADGLDDTVARMRDLEAPDDAKDEFDTFLKEVSASADTMRDVGKAVDAKDVEKMTDAVSKLQEHMTKVGSAQAALQTAIN
jgi:cell fate (sporulation/competence/biofilm development) regulator YlbF (YheA/YmcA/DUF963 family)